MRHWKALIPVAALAVATTLPSARFASAQSLPVVLEGTALMVVEDDFARGRATKRYFLDQPATRTRKELKLSPQQAEGFQPGKKARVKGKLSGDTLEVEATVDGLVVDESSATAEASGPVAARKALILLVDITDAGNVKHVVSANCDGGTDLAATLTFGFNTTAASVDGCYQDSSFGNLGVGGAAYPGTDLDVQRVSIADSVTSCNYTSWGSKADAAAANLASYQHRVYVVPADVNCGWAGLAYINACPGPYCQSWVKAYSGQACGYVDAIGHELAHNLGLMHASTDLNNDGTHDCEYCDDSDFMGYAEANLRPLNGPHRIQMGWLSGGQIVDASAGGQFTLAPLNQRAAPLPQVARINVPNGHPYYVSYRTGIGYDSFLASTVYSRGVLNEISVHRWPGGVNNTRFVTSLADGEAFSDGVNSITVVQNSHTAGGATFTVSIGLQPPTTPTNLKATAGNAQVALTWNASAGATGYNVRQALAGGLYHIIALGISSPAFTDTGLVNGQTYNYIVSAKNGTTESANSAPVSATPNGVDLVMTAVSNPPSALAPGASFSATDTVRNQGAATAAASGTRYYFSVDKLPGGSILLGGSRSVGSLAAGQSSSGNATATIPSTTPSGTYYLLSCADGQNAVIETDEANNCRASAAAIQVTRPDLVITTLTNPPASAARGAKFRVTDTTANQGPVTAGASSTRYYLSVDQQKGAADVLLTGSRSVGSLGAAKLSKGNANATIPSATPAGTYYLLACADDLAAVTESNEANNCRSSTSKVTVP